VDFDLHVFTPFLLLYKQEGSTPQTRIEKISATQNTARFHRVGFGSPRPD
jgi:hypothetical protein